MPTDLIKLDFNTSTPSPTLSGWTGSNVNPGQVDFINTHGSYTIRYYNGNVDNSRDRGALGTNTTPVGYSDLYRDFWFDNPGPYNLEIGGLSTSTDYDIRLFAFDISNKNHDVDFVDITAGSYGSTGTVFNGGSDPTTDNQSSVVVRVKSDTSGKVQFTVQRNGGVGFALCNGLIVTTVDAAGATGHYYRYLLNRRRVHA